MQILMIRHGQTKGNLEKRYIGSSDEPLCEQTCHYLERYCQQRKNGCPDKLHLYVSPMKRCIQTASFLFPGYRQEMVNELRECDFGLWEGKNYEELQYDPDYQKWLDSGGSMPFPEGESKAVFTQRCRTAFTEIMKKERPSDRDVKLCLVVHGGTIMALGEQFSSFGKGYYDYQTAPLCGYRFCWDENQKLFTEEQEWKLGDAWFL